MTKVVIECTVEQAQAASTALEVFSRLSIGQIEHLAELVSFGEIPVGGRYTSDGKLLERLIASPSQAQCVRDMCDQIKAVMGYPKSGSNGIGHSHVSSTAHRTWEMRKVLDKALSEHRNPNPEFRGVNYDGLTVRYTTDPEPLVTVTG